MSGREWSASCLFLTARTHRATKLRQKACRNDRQSLWSSIVEANRLLTHAVAATFLLIGFPSASLAQQVSEEAIKRIVDAREAYYQVHPEARAEALAAAKAAPVAKARTDGHCARPIYPR